MNKQSVASIVLFVCVSFVSLVLIASVQVPFFLTGGSDALEIIIKPSNFSMWLALTLFLFSWLLSFVLPKLKQQGHIGLKMVLTFLALTFFLMSGHNLRYSGKQHALIDRWFFVPVQTVSINPTTYIENGRFERTVFSVNGYSGDTKILSIWLGLPPWRLNENEVTSVFHDLGFELDIERK